jgi:membrane protein
LLSKSAMAHVGAISSYDEPRSVWRGRVKIWRETIKRVAIREVQDDLDILAGGVALFAILSLMPALATVISIYSLISSPADIASQVAPLGRVVPPEVVAVATDQLKAAADSPPSDLGLATAFTLALAIFGATGGVRSLIAALNLVHHRPDRRSFLKRTGIAMALGIGAMVTVMLSVGLVVILPTAFQVLRVEADTEAVVNTARWPLLFGVVAAGLAILYRVGPDESPRSLVAGTLFASIAWLAGSFGLSFYVSEVANYSGLYGAFGGVMILILWFFVSSFVILIGALINEELEGVRRELTGSDAEPSAPDSAAAPPRPTPAPRSPAG